MHLRSIVSLTGVMAISTTLLAAPAPADLKGLDGTFSLSHTTQIPSETLKPGDYTIHIVDSFGDRLIVRIDGPGQQGALHLPWGRRLPDLPLRRPGSYRLEYGREPPADASRLFVRLKAR